MSELEVRTGGVEALNPSPVFTSNDAPYVLTVVERDPPHRSATGKLFDQAPTPTEGGGGWEEVALPKRAGVLVWKGRGLMKLSLNMLFDRFSADRAVGSDYATLQHLWRPVHPTSEPPVVKLSSAGDVVPHQDLDWVITNLEWSPNGQANLLGERTQQVFAITFTEYRPDERLQTVEQAKRKRGRKTVWTVRRDGESLGAIAEHYHVKGGWKALGAAQHPPIKDPRHTHKNQKIIVPLP